MESNWMRQYFWYNTQNLVDFTCILIDCRLSEIGPDDIAKQEAEAYSAYKGQGHFTANPEMMEQGETHKSR